jgi:hypothetical protein
LKDDSTKYGGLKVEESQKVKEIEEIHGNLDQELKEVESNIREFNKEMELIKKNYQTQHDKLQKEIYVYMDAIRILETNQKESKHDQETTKLNFEVEISNLNHILRNSEKNL